MKAHKYWSLGALACMAGMLLHGLQETDAGSQVFRLRLSDLHGHGNLLRSQNCAEEEKS